MSGGTTNAMAATFIYDDADWLLPAVQYQVDAAGVGRLSLKQQPTQRPSMQVGPLEWNLRLNDRLPMGIGRLKLQRGAA
jgi:hypothetical protein